MSGSTQDEREKLNEAARELGRAVWAERWHLALVVLGIELLIVVLRLLGAI